MTRSLTFVSSLTLLAGVAALAACSGNDGYYNDNDNSAGLQCGAPSGQLALAYPAPGATGIPDNFQGVIFAVTKRLPTSYQAVVVAAGSSNGEQLEPVAQAPSPLPTPYAAPSFTNPIYQESGSGGLVLPANTVVSVYLNDLGSNCSPTKLLGTFTTQ